MAHERWPEGPLYPTSLHAGEKVAHAIQSALQILRRGRIGDADVILGAEAFSGNDHDVRIVK